MAKVTLPIAEVELGGSMQQWHYDNAIIRTDVKMSINNGDSITEGTLELTLGNVGSVLAAGGEVESYLMAVQAPLSLLDTDVPAGLPRNTTLNGSAVEVSKTFSNWFVKGAEIWKKDDDSEIIFYTNPFAGNVSLYLKGSELSIINDIHATVVIETIAQAQAIIDAGGWTKIEY